MSMSLYSGLKNIQRVLYVALGILVLAAAFSILGSLLHYLIAAIIAAILFTFHWLTRNNAKAVKWRKYWTMLFPILTVLAPVIYLLSIFFSGSKKWVVFFQLSSVALPLLLIMFAIYSIQKILDQL